MNVLINGRFHTYRASSFACKWPILSKKLDGLPGRINEPQRRGWVFESDRHVMRYHSAPSLGHKQREGEGCLQKKRKENVKRDLCRSPKKLKKHENNQILPCCRTAVFPYKYILLYFSFLEFPCRAVVALLFQQLICWLDPFLM